MGSSIVKRAEQYAKRSGLEFAYSVKNFHVVWKGIFGMRFRDLHQTLVNLLSTNRPPRYLVVHCGGNDIGSPDTPLRRLQMFIKFTIAEIVKIMPNTCIIWSHILPRLYWRYTLSSSEADKSRKRINSSIATFVLKISGVPVKYTQINASQKHLFVNDGVHLSTQGNTISCNIAT